MYVAQAQEPEMSRFILLKRGDRNYVILLIIICSEWTKRPGDRTPDCVEGSNAPASRALAELQTSPGGFFFPLRETLLTMMDSCVAITS